VTEAERILADDTRKQRYDQSLRQAVEAAGAPAAAADPRASRDSVQKVVSPPTLPRSKAVAPDRITSPAPQQVASAHARPVALLRPAPARQPVWSAAVEWLQDSARGAGCWALAWWEALHGGAPVKFSLAIAFVGGVIALLVGRFDWSETFPTPTVASRAAGEYSMTATLPPRPAIDSIPGQRVGLARNVPGLENTEGYAPTLNAALTNIIFAARSGDRRTDDLDLYQATRSKPSESFQPPTRLSACSSPEIETDPALSPDGLELVFVRISPTGESALLRSTRNASGDEFSEPQRLQIPGLAAEESVSFDSPQLLRDGGDLLVRVSRRDAGGTRSTIFRSPRSRRDRPFEAAEELPVFVEQARHFLSADGLRGYVSRQYTIQLSCRPSANAPFSAPGKLDVLNATRIGQAEGPVWVSPAEDFLFYCVTVISSSHQQRRYVRQVRIR
jgi:hypothetical protein